MMKNLTGRPSLKGEFTGEQGHRIHRHLLTVSFVSPDEDTTMTSTSSRWLLARPRGGLNDVLCQVERCWRFAEKTGRELVFDTRDSGLLLDFHDVFTVREDVSSAIPHKLTPQLVTYLNTLSAFPKDTEGNVDGYSSYKDDNDEFHTLPSRSPLKFSLKRDFAEDVVVYEGMGGGVASFCALSRISLQHWLVDRIIGGLSRLPSEYLSVHVRNTDMRTMYQDFLRKVQSTASPNMPIFLASDSQEVFAFARELFASRELHYVHSERDRDGRPLHDASMVTSQQNRRERTGEMFEELFSLANGSELFFTNVEGGTRVSGFSRLASHLISRPALRSNLLSNSTTAIQLPRGKPRHVASLRERLVEKVRWGRERRRENRMHSNK